MVYDRYFENLEKSIKNNCEKRATNQTYIQIKFGNCFLGFSLQYFIIRLVIGRQRHSVRPEDG
jgi:hypothetical protein